MARPRLNNDIKRLRGTYQPCRDPEKGEKEYEYGVKKAHLRDYQVKFLTCEDPFLVEASEFPNRFTINKLWGLALGQGFDGWNGKELWTTYGDEYLQDWISEHPGTRPYAWWMFGSPDADQMDWYDRRQRAEWSRKRKCQYLKTHGLLAKGETDE